MAFLQVRILSIHPGFVDEALMVAGALAVSFIDAEDQPVLEPLPGETPLWSNTITLGLFADGTPLEPIETLLRTLVPDGNSLTVTAEWVEDQDWVRAWLEHWEPLPFGRRLWVTPAEKRGSIRAPGAVIMTLDPGLAFGTGTHPTTALCLEWLDRQSLQGATVLDYGCGSGILAIAALLLGASRAICTDIDPQALHATGENAVTNGVADRLSVYLPEALPSVKADVVMANILAGPLVQLAPRLLASMRPGSRLVLAGLLERQADEVRAAYAANCDFDTDAVTAGWTRISGTHR